MLKCLMKYCKGCNTNKQLTEFNKGLGSQGKHTYCRLCQSERHKDWKAANREKDLARMSEWKSENKERHRLESIRWRKENPERWKEIVRRKEYKRKGGGKLPPGAYKTLVKLYGESCLRCGAVDDLTIDHVTPIALGGKSNLDNLQILCRSCNSSKSSRSSADYRP